MPIREMYEDHSLSTLINAVTGFRKQINDQTKDAWERARMIAFYTVNIQVQVKDRMKNWKEMFPLPWEPEFQQKVKPVNKIKTKEEFIQLMKGK